MTVDPNTGQAIAGQTMTIPALKVRRAETTVEIPSGGSLVIAGLIQETTRQNLDSVPGVKDVPVLGALFRSRDFQNEEHRTGRDRRPTWSIRPIRRASAIQTVAM